nr:sulfur carrier protein ThiS [Catenulispora pinistramenti]
MSAEHMQSSHTQSSQMQSSQMQSSQMQLSVNGEPSQLTEGTTVADLVLSLVQAARDGNRGGIAVAVNETVVPRASWDGTPLAAGDRVEILTAVQGG